MKKLLVLSLSLFIILSLIACNKDTPAKTDIISSIQEETTQQTSSIDSGSSTTEQHLQVDKGLFDVKITFPASLFAESQSTPEEIEAAAKEQGVKKVTFNDDGSVTYEMNKDTHKKLVESMKDGIDDSITKMLNDPDGTNSFKSVTYNDNCSEFSVFVDRSKYSEWDSLSALGFYVQGTYYQSLQGAKPKDIKVIVNFIDKDTKEIINTADSSKLADE